MNLVTILKSVFGIGTTSYEPNMVFRVMFVSPFFELEIDTGNGWRTIHAQTPEHVTEDGTAVYPILRFPSFPAAVDYATKTLGITSMRPHSALTRFFLRICTSPPVSYSKGVEPCIIEPQHLVNNKVIHPSKVQAPAQRVAGFTVYNGEEPSLAT